MSPRSLTIALVTLAALGAAVVLFVGGGDAPDAPLVGTDTPGEPGATAADPAGDRPDGPDGTAIEVTPFEDEEAEDDPGRAAVDDPGSRAAILVVAADGSPVSGASVVLRRERDRFRALFDGGPPARPAARATTGRRGVAYVPGRLFRGERVAVTARKDDRVGFELVDPDDTEPDGPYVARVRLEPLRRLVVDVRRPSGGPAGDVRVAVSPDGPPFGGGRDGRRGRGRGFELLTQWTARKTGRATFELTPDLSSIREDGKARVQVTVIGGERISRVVELPPEGDADTVVQLPATAALTVELRTHDGRPFTETTQLEWRVERDEEDDRRRGGGRGGFRALLEGGFGRRTVRDGRTRIGGFTPGASVVFEVPEPGHLPEETRVVVPPAGAERTVEVAVGRPRPFVLATLVERGGTPVALQRLDHRIRTGPEEERRGRARDFLQRMRRRMRAGRGVRTDADGRVRIPVDPHVTGVVELSLRQGRGRRRGFRRDGDAPPLATLRFPVLAPGAELDLGRVIVDRGPLLAEGRVVDPEGAPLAGIRVVVSAEETEGEGGGRRGRGRRGRGRRTFEERTGADGRFAIRAFWQESWDFQIAAQGRGRASPELVLTPGARDLDLVASATGGLAGRVRVADPSLGIRPAVELRDLRAEQDDRRAWRRARVDPSGAFRRGNLIAGPYVVRVRLEGHVVFESGPIAVPEGAVAEPPELADLVVGEGFFAGEVLVRDSSGGAIARATVTPRSEGGRFRGMERTDERGVARLVLPPDTSGLSVLVRARGFSTAEVRQPVFPLQVTLEPLVSLALALEPPLPAAADLAGGRVRLEAADGQPGGDDRRGFLARFRRRGLTQRVRPGQASVSFARVAPGTYGVTLEVMGASGSPLEGRRISVELGPVVVPQGNPTASAVLELDAAAILERLARSR